MNPVHPATDPGSAISRADAGASSEGWVRTVLGDIPADQLGTTLMHEHLVVDTTVYWLPEEDPALAVRPVSLETLHDVRAHVAAARDNLVLNDLECAAREMARYRNAGGSAVVEVTGRSLGRDVRALKLISQLSGIHVVAGTGYYISESLPPGFGRRSVAALSEEFTREIVDGIDATGIRAGVIGEIGPGGYPMEPVERRILQAAAHAQRATGALIMTHSPLGLDAAFEVVRVLDRAGADLSRVVVGHIDARFRDDVELYRRLGSSGCVFGFDTIGREAYYTDTGQQHPTDTVRVEAIAKLVADGFGDRIVMAQDICTKMDLAAFGGHGYSRVVTNTVPRLIRRGVSIEAVNRMLVRTPARLLAFAQPATVAPSPGATSGSLRWAPGMSVAPPSSPAAG